MYGWLDWAKNGEKSGTEGFGYRLEGIEIVLVEKGGTPPEEAIKHPIKHLLKNKKESNDSFFILS